ncbi:GntR family transcriptional regulator [Paenibacillus montanisoli]|uniref:HTH gntR-type domain-containing protein n=1 Tax=Paenibacillus montanisoli TaxID=2081970 RepID=A0A328U5R8_9BACL|nr:GntR family transcriptional regulator [Paenibacillus montanisoli]RAP77900.1 hypothetical protein DL346_05440 [Paenibacillus montanisoli]
MMRSSISKVKPLYSQAYILLKNSITNGEFQPGERITELRLAEMFGISRGPVREVIRMLIQDGLLTQNEGPIQVYNPTKEDIIEVFLCRECLEALATRQAAHRMTPDMRDQLLLNVDNTRKAIDEQNASELCRLDQQFHELVIEASGNRQLIELSSVIQAKVAYMRNQILSHFYQHFIDTVDEHLRIVQALTDGDAHKAEEEMRHHIEKAVDVYRHLAN